MVDDSGRRRVAKCMLHGLQLRPRRRRLLPVETKPWKEEYTAIDGLDYGYRDTSLPVPFLLLLSSPPSVFRCSPEPTAYQTYGLGLVAILWRPRKLLSPLLRKGQSGPNLRSNRVFTNHLPERSGDQTPYKSRGGQVSTVVCTDGTDQALRGG